MAEAKASNGLDDAPEIKLARKILKRHGLKPPFDMRALLEKYATVLFDDIPNVDGVSLHIKVPGKTPTVVVNRNKPATRQNFTMAHELGHIIIPWHIGTLIADNANSFVIPESIYEASQAYWGIENEANRFAAELLMPRDWVLEQINELPDLARLHEVVTLHCGVSPQAAAYRLESFLPPHIVYCAEDSMVQYSGRTIGTHAYALTKGEMFLEEFIPNCYFPYCKAKFSWRLGGTTFHWWILPSIIEVAPDDNRNWREVLENIIMDINPPPGEIDFRLSVNGIIAAANGELKRAKTTKYSVESLIAISFQRFHNRDELANFIAHPDFKVYVQKRAIELVRKPEKRKRRSK